MSSLSFLGGIRIVLTPASKFILRRLVSVFLSVKFSPKRLFHTQKVFPLNLSFSKDNDKNPFYKVVGHKIADHKVVDYPGGWDLLNHPVIKYSTVEVGGVFAVADGFVAVYDVLHIACPVLLAVFRGIIKDKGIRISDFECFHGTLTRRDEKRQIRVMEESYRSSYLRRNRVRCL